MNKYNLTREQLNLLRDVSKLHITKDGKTYKLNDYLIFRNKGEDIQLYFKDINNMLYSSLLNSDTSDMNTEQRNVGPPSMTSDIFTKPSNNINTDSDATSTMNTAQMNGDASTTSDINMDQRGGRNNNNNNNYDMTSSVNPNMFKNASMSTTSDDVKPNTQQGGRNNNNYDMTSSVNPNMFKNASMSTTSDVAMNQQGGQNDFMSSDNTAMVKSKLFNESSVMSSSLDLSEMSDMKPSKKNNKNIFNTSQVNMKGGNNNSKDETIRMIKQKLQELQSSTIGLSIQNELSHEHRVDRIQAGGFSNLLGKSNSYQAGGANKKLSNKILKEIGINSSSTSEFCD
jgi:hypothetical protein